MGHITVLAVMLVCCLLSLWNTNSSRRLLVIERARVAPHSWSPNSIEKGLSYNNDNYFQMALNGRFPITNSLVSFQVMKDYVQQHSQAQLIKEWNGCTFHNETTNWTACPFLKDRKFVVGLYSCPQEAGNRLHAFMNALLWAISTNRTFLWRYEDTAACSEYPHEKKEDLPNFCSMEYNNTKQDCDKVLVLSDWIPSFEEWNTKLHLPAAELVGGYRKAVYDSPNASLLIRTGSQLKPSQAFNLQKRQHRHEVLSIPENRERAARLVAQGYSFTYGLLFESLFTLQPSVLPEPNLVVKDNDAATFFLHSRHPFHYLNAADTYHDRMCLHRLLENHTYPSCFVYVMSDRNVTVELLKKDVQNVSCTPIAVNHSVFNPNPLRQEHGPFSGVGYFQDYALARNARHGYIAFHRFQRPTIRTSSALIYSTVQFRRVLEANSTANLNRLKSCTSY